jgi:NAD(P)-dependent dehydrogenase (short-subunit alcohol dehydrogenase family)
VSYSLAGKTVVVTGAAGGIGRAIALECGVAGARVAVLDIDAAGAGRVADEVTNRGGKALAFPCDVTSEEQIRSVMTEVVAKLGGIDVLVNNAGITQLGTMEETDLSIYRRVFDINVFGAIHCTKAALAELRSRRGMVVVLSSVAGFAPLYGRSGYSGSKHALHGLFETLRCEVAADGVQVMLVCPSFTDTSIEKHALGGGPRPTVGKAATPESVASAIRAGIEGRRRLLVLGPIGLASWWMTRFAPALYERVMTKRMVGDFRRG